MNWTDCEPAKSCTTSAHLQESAWPQMGSAGKGRVEEPEEHQLSWYLRCLSDLDLLCQQWSSWSS